MCGRLNGMLVAKEARLFKEWDWSRSGATYALADLQDPTTSPVSRRYGWLGCRVRRKWLKAFQLARHESMTSVNPGASALATSAPEEKKTLK